MKKKLFTGLLAVSMVMCTYAPSAFATDDMDITGNQNGDSVVQSQTQAQDVQDEEQGEEEQEVKILKAAPTALKAPKAATAYKKDGWLYTLNEGILTITEPGSISEETPELPSDFYTANDVLEVKFDGVKIKNGFYASGYIGAKTTKLDMSGADTSAMTNMYRMFANCGSLEELNLTGFDTSKVRNMSSMFAYCSGLKKLDLTGFSTESLTNVLTMFYGCTSLESIDFGTGFNTSKVTNMGGMFQGCAALENLDIAAFDTSGATNMRCMLYGCKALKSISFGENFNTSKVINMGGMFQDCESLTAIDLSKFNTEKVKAMDYMFRGCIALQSLDLSGFKTSNVTNMEGMFCDCRSLTSLDVTKLDTSNVTNMKFMFRKLSLKNIDLSTLNTAKVEDMSYMFSYSAFEELNLSGFDLSSVKEKGAGMLYMFYQEGASPLKKLITPASSTADKFTTSLPHIMYDDKNGDELEYENKYEIMPLGTGVTIWAKNPVTFMAADRTSEIAMQYVKYGKSADTAKVSAPAVGGSYFINWVNEDGTAADLGNVTQPMTVYANYGAIIVVPGEMTGDEVIEDEETPLEEVIEDEETPLEEEAIEDEEAPLAEEVIEDEETPLAENTSDVPKTGDNSNMPLMLALLAASAVGIAGAVKTKKNNVK